jgi:hypothetical protein
MRITYLGYVRVTLVSHNYEPLYGIHVDDNYRVSDPHSLNPDPDPGFAEFGFNLDQDPDQGFFEKN